MVEQNAAAAEDVVAFAVVDGHPVGIEFSHPVRTARIEIGVFILGYGLDLAEHFGSGSLIETDFGIDDAYGFEQVQGTQAGNLAGGVGLIEADAHETLGSKIINLRRPTAFNQANGGTQIRQVKLDQMEIGMISDTQFFQTPEAYGTGTAVSAIDGVTLLQQE